MPSDVRANVVSTTGRVAAELARLESELTVDAQNLRDRASLAFGQPWDRALAVGAPRGPSSDALLHGYSRLAGEVGLLWKAWRFPEKLATSLNSWWPRWGNQFGHGRKLITDRRVADVVTRKSQGPAVLQKVAMTEGLRIVFGLWGVWAGIEDARKDSPYRSTPGKIDRADIELASDIAGTISSGAALASGVAFLAAFAFPPAAPVALPVAGLLWTVSRVGGLGSAATDVALEHWEGITSFGSSAWETARHGWNETAKVFSRLGDRVGL